MGLDIADIPEHDLPVSIRIALETARAARPDERLTCVAFYTSHNDHEVASMGSIFGADHMLATPLPPCLASKALVVLSVTTTEASLRDVRTVKHVLITHAHRWRPERLVARQ